MSQGVGYSHAVVAGYIQYTIGIQEITCKLFKRPWLWMLRCPALKSVSACLSTTPTSLVVVVVVLVLLVVLLVVVVVQVLVVVVVQVVV